MLWSWGLFVLYIGLGIVNVARGLLAFSLRHVLPEASVPVEVLGWLYLAWGVGFLICTGVGMRRLNRARWLLLGCAVAYQATGWAVRLWGDASTYARQLWSRDAVLSALFLAIVILLLHLSTRFERSRDVATAQ